MKNFKYTKSKKNIMKKRGIVLSLTIIVLLLVPNVLADGMILPPYGPPIPEHQQLALISLQDGREHMLLSVQTDDIHEKSAWIVPVPASHTETVINILPDFPRLYGYDIKQTAKREMDSMLTNIQMTQIYPILFFSFGLARPMYYGRKLMGLAEETEAYEGVEIHEHIEKEGVITELISATSSVSFYNYLRDQGLNVSEEGIPVLSYYIGKDYTFVVSWLSPKEETGNRIEEDAYYPYPYRRRPAIFVSFPAEKPYYPLIPTSIYGSLEVPTTIYLIGLYQPETFTNIKPYITTKYLKQETIYGIQPLEANIFFGQAYPRNVVFTRVDLNAPSKLLTQDLYFKKGAPATVSMSLGIITMLRKAGWLSYLLFCAVFSAISGMLAGLISFKQLRKGKFALLGLANVFTIISLIIAITFFRTKKVDPETRRMLKKERLAVVSSDVRKVWVVVSFTIIFLIITGIFRVIF